MSSLLCSLFFWSDLTSKLNAAAYDTPTVAEVFVRNVSSRAGLACMGRERASILSLLIVRIFEVIVEIVVSGFISSQGRIILEWGYVNGRS